MSGRLPVFTNILVVTMASLAGGLVWTRWPNWRSMTRFISEWWAPVLGFAFAFGVAMISIRYKSWTTSVIFTVLGFAQLRIAISVLGRRLPSQSRSHQD